MESERVEWLKVAKDIIIKRPVIHILSLFLNLEQFQK